MVKSLVRNGQFEEVEKLLVVWKSSGNVYDFQAPLILIDGYLKKNLSDKAKNFLDNLVNERMATTTDMWGLVADSFLKKGDFKKASSYMECAFSLPLEKKDWKLDSKTIQVVKGGMYHTLMKAYISSDKDLGFLCHSMKDGGIDENEETRNILNGQMKR
ncbi:pentatricopeptide repeat-containing protein [Tanacetum coccineum]